MKKLEKQILTKLNKVISTHGRHLAAFNKFNNIKDTNSIGWDILIYITGFLDIQNILNNEETEYLIKNSNLKNQDVLTGNNALFLLMRQNKTKNYNLSPELWDYMIMASGVDHISLNETDALTSYIAYRKKEEIILSPATLNLLLNHRNKRTRRINLIIAQRYDELELMEEILKRMTPTEIKETKKTIEKKVIINKIDEVLERLKTAEKINKITGNKIKNNNGRDKSKI